MLLTKHEFGWLLRIRQNKKKTIEKAERGRGHRLRLALNWIHKSKCLHDFSNFQDKLGKYICCKSAMKIHIGTFPGLNIFKWMARKVSIEQKYIILCLEKVQVLLEPYATSNKGIQIQKQVQIEKTNSNKLNTNDIYTTHWHRGYLASVATQQVPVVPVTFVQVVAMLPKSPQSPHTLPDAFIGLVNGTANTRDFYEAVVLANTCSGQKNMLEEKRLWDVLVLGFRKDLKRVIPLRNFCVLNES